MKKAQSHPDGHRLLNMGAGKNRVRIFAKLLESSSLPFSIGLVDGRVGPCNEAFSKLLCYSQEELQGMHWSRDLTPPEWRELVAERIGELNRTGKPVRYEKEFFRKDGSRVPVEMLVHVDQDRKGAPQFYYGFVLDLTKRKQAEEALQKSHAELEQKVKDRTSRLRALAGELTSIEQRERRRIAHVLHEQLQQHLCGMKFRASHLKEGSATPAMIGLADRLVKELDDAIQLTRTLTTDLHPPVLSHLRVRDAIEWLGTDVEEKMGLSVTVRTNKRVPMISGELKIFAFEAARELLLNVVKHAKVKAAELRLDSIGKGMVRIQVRDKGVGIDAKQDKEANSHFGLFRIQERTESFGGRFEMVSQPGKGTCVTLILPLS